MLNQRIVDLEGPNWDGYLFPSNRSSTGHIAPQTVNEWFKRLVEDAEVTVEAETPTAKMGRRFWYTTYNEAVKQMMEGIEGIAADQGSASTEVVSQNYLSEAEKRRYRRESMREELSAVFGSMTDKDKIAIYERYSSGDLSEDATRVLLGDEFDMLQEDIKAFREAIKDDTRDYLV